MNEIRPAIILTFLFALFTGIIFPAVIWAGAQLFFPTQANGSLAYDREHRPVGSYLLAQNFSSAKYFHPRPSAASYNPASSTGSNLGPISDKHIHGVKDDPSTPDVDESFAGVIDLAESYRMENGLSPDALLPADAATRSSSGLDPDISPQNALLQSARVAKARGLQAETVKGLLAQHTRRRFIGLFGEPRVNVLEVNLALDEMPANK